MSEASGSSNECQIENGGDATEDKLARVPDAKAASSGLEKKLTPEEQMALYEKELKENDWGHQPC